MVNSPSAVSNNQYLSIEKSETEINHSKNWISVSPLYSWLGIDMNWRS